MNKKIEKDSHIKEMKEETTDTIETQRIIRKYYEQLYANN